jgi:hypothetical protein
MVCCVINLPTQLYDALAEVHSFLSEEKKGTLIAEEVFYCLLKKTHMYNRKFLPNIKVKD